MVNMTYDEGYTPKDAENFSLVVAHAEAREKERLVERLSGHLKYEERREYLTNLIQRRGN
jgi:hypothetical protein